MSPDEIPQPFAVLTGASSGIGMAIAVAMAARGWLLLLVGRRLEALLAVADAVAQAGGRAEVLVADLSSPDAPAAIAAAADRCAGAVDAVVHSAALFDHGGFGDASADGFRRLLEVNVVAPAELTRRLLPALSRSRQGQVVFINSSAGLRATPNLSQYSATKHALKAVADSVRLEFPDLRVFSVYMGRTDTPMQQEYHRREGRPYNPEALIRPSTIARTVVDALSLPADASITDIQIRAAKPV